MTTQRHLLLGLTLTIAACPGDETTTVGGSTGETDTSTGDGSTTGTPTTDPPTTLPTTTTDPTVDPTTETGTSTDPLTSTTTPGDTTDTTTTVDTTGTSTGDTSDTSTGSSSDGSSTGSSTDDSSTSTTDSSTGSTTDTDTDSDTNGEAATIYDIQDGTIPEDAAVEVQAVVVTAIATTGSGFMAQEHDGGQFSGCWVFVGDIDISMLAVGDEVNITGVTQEFNGLTEIDASAGSVTETGVSGVVLAPEVLPIATFSDPMLAEPWEGVHVRVEGDPLTVSMLLPGDEFLVTNGSSARIDNIAYVVAGKPEFPNFGTSATFTSISGPLNFSVDAFKISPRSAADLTGYMPSNNPVLGVEALKAGDLVVTEIMYNPTCNNDDCEWIEVLNKTASPVDLNGLVIQDTPQNPNAQGKVSVSAIVQPGAYAVLGYKTMVTWPYPNPPTAFYGANPPLGNSANGDRVFLKNSMLTIDATATYTGQNGLDAGKSWKLDPTKQTAADNDSAMNWCYSSAVFFMTETGSPGALNEAMCAAI